MTEQQVADLFSEQVDRLLAGDAVADIPGLDDWPDLAGLGGQLTQIRFEPTPAAQVAFDSQLAAWFGPPAGGSSAPFLLGMSKNSLLGIVATIAAIGGGLGLVFLIGTIFPGLFSFDPAGELSIPATTESPTPVTPQAPAPPVLSPLETNDLRPNPTGTKVPPAAGDTLPDVGSSLKDTLPSATQPRGDTLPTMTATPTEAPTLTSTATSASSTEPAPEFIEDEPGSTDMRDGPAKGPDDDRGHGNDPDRYDEDNPGQSTGAGQNDDRGGGSTGGGKGGGKNK